MKRLTYFALLTAVLFTSSELLAQRRGGGGGRGPGGAGQTQGQPGNQQCNMNGPMQGRQGQMGTQGFPQGQFQQTRLQSRQFQQVQFQQGQFGVQQGQFGRRGSGQGNRGQGQFGRNQQGNNNGQRGSGQMSREEQMIKNRIDSIPVGELTQEERAGMVLMREEEKLAHDVYYSLFQKWGLKPFSNIQNSESRHMLAMKYMLDRYQITDPIQNNTVGVFQSVELQKLYKDLVTKGLSSRENAVQTGLLIEEMDIADLQKLMNQTDNEDLRIVYANLLRGSRNHLRAFSRLMSRSSGSYTPQYLSQEEFDKIASGKQEKGPSGLDDNSKGRGRGKGNQQNNNSGPGKN